MAGVCGKRYRVRDQARSFDSRREFLIRPAIKSVFRDAPIAAIRDEDVPGCVRRDGDGIIEASPDIEDRGSGKVQDLDAMIGAVADK